MSTFLGFYTISFHHVSRASLISECVLPTSINQSSSNPFYSGWILKPNLTADTCPLGIESSQTFNSIYWVIPFRTKFMKQTLTDAGRSQNRDLISWGKWGIWGSRGQQRQEGTLWSDGNVLYLDLGGITGVYIHINSLNCTLQICAFYVPHM